MIDLEGIGTTIPDMCCATAEGYHMANASCLIILVDYFVECLNKFLRTVSVCSTGGIFGLLRYELLSPQIVETYMVSHISISCSAYTYVKYVQITSEDFIFASSYYNLVEI